MISEVHMKIENGKVNGEIIIEGGINKTIFMDFI